MSQNTCGGQWITCGNQLSLPKWVPKTTFTWLARWRAPFLTESSCRLGNAGLNVLTRFVKQGLFRITICICLCRAFSGGRSVPTVIYVLHIILTLRTWCL